MLGTLPKRLSRTPITRWMETKTRATKVGNATIEARHNANLS